MSEWIKTADKLPDADSNCFVFYKNSVRILYWNNHHKVWDDESGDDYFCDAEDCSHWMPFIWPNPPSDI